MNSSLAHPRTTPHGSCSQSMTTSSTDGRQEMEMETKKSELTEALAIARNQMETPKFNKIHPHFHQHKYADLSSVLAAVIPSLSAHGLCIVQTTRRDQDGTLILITTLRHKNGESICSEYPVLPIKQLPQDYGAALTYARRYSICALLAIAAEEDTDGVAPTSHAKIRTEKTTMPSLLSEQQRDELELSCKNHNIDVGRFWVWACKSTKAQDRDAIPSAFFFALLNKIPELSNE